MSDHNTDIVIVDLKGLAERLKVPQKVVKKAVETGQLKAGVHYMLIGDEPRFHWCKELISKIHQTCAAVTEKQNLRHEKKISDVGKKPIINGRSSFDLNSLQ